jgi:hypothetical protein
LNETVALTAAAFVVPLKMNEVPYACPVTAVNAEVLRTETLVAESGAGPQKNFPESPELVGQLAPETGTHEERTVTESFTASVGVYESVTETVAVSPWATVADDAPRVSVWPTIAALDAGAVDNKPNPKATTTASAIRLKLVLLDI